MSLAPPPNPTEERGRPLPARDTSPRPPVWVVAREYGGSSTIWIERQVRGFRHHVGRVVAWAKGPFADAASEGIDVSWIPTPATPDYDWRRWGKRLQNLPSGNFYGAVGAERRILTRLIRDHRPSAILAHFGHSALRVLPVAEAESIPLVAHFHGLDVSSSLIADRWYRWSFERCLNRFAAVVVVGSHQRRLIIEQGLPEDRVHLIPCGVPTRMFAPRGGEPSKRFRFIAVSRLEPWKGLSFTLRAFAEVRRHEPEVELHIVGEGTELLALRRLAAQLGLAEDAVFHGRKLPGEVQRLLSDADAFVQHSIVTRQGEPSAGWVEGFGVSIAEGAACGLPVVGTDVGGIPDQVVHAETGFLVPQRDVAAMAEAMLLLVRDRDLTARMGAAGREHVVRHFDADRQIEKLERVLLDASSFSERRPG